MPPARGAHARIAITNHSPEFLELIRSLLEEEGYEVLIPPDLEHPFAFIKAQRPDAVILDLLFRREGESLAVLDLLRLAPETTAIPVVLCTTSASALEGVRKRAEEQGIRVLIKPFDLDDLLAALRDAVAQGQGRGTR